MKNHPLFTVLIFLTIVTSFNRGEKINELIAKFNERRAAGILAQPRVGRTTGVGSFGRADGVTGLVHYPRVGRSDLQLIAGHQNYPLGLDTKMKNHRYFSDYIPLDVGDPKAISDENFRKQLDSAHIVWLDALRFATRKDQQHQTFHCDNHMEAAWILLLNPSDVRKAENQQIRKYSLRVPVDQPHLDGV